LGTPVGVIVSGVSGELVAGERETVRRTAQALGYAWGRNDQGYRDERGDVADSWAFAHYFLTVADQMTIQDAWARWLSTSRMNDAQRRALRALCERYGVAFCESDFTRGVFGLPPDYVGGQVGPICLGCDHNGRISS
jgi:hypothetical protein